MKKIIHHLRSQSEKKKRYILNLSVMIFAFILFSIWIYSLGYNFSNKDKQVQLQEGLAPLQSLKDNIVGGYNSLSQPSLSEENQ